MNQTSLEILVKLKDEASAAFKSVGDTFTKTGNEMSSKLGFLNKDVSGFAKVLGGVAVAGGAALTAFLYSSAKAAAEAETAMARVTATLESMGEEALKNKDAILKAADAAVKLGFDDEDAAESITKMYQRTRDLTEAQKLSALAMDLARAKNIDLSAATNLVGQVLSGNGRILKQYGIEISETLPPLEALKQLQIQVGGQADAFSQTFAGQMAILSTSFQNIKEEIGGVLLTALMPFIQQFTTWLLDPKTKESFQKWTDGFKSWAEVIIPTVIETFRIWATVLETIFKTLTFIGDKITFVVDKLTALRRFGEQTDLPGMLVSSARRLIGLADGGIVTQPTLAMIGEGHGPEAVIPLDRLGSFASGGGGITINMSGNFYGSDEELARRMGNHIAEIIGQQLRVRTI